MKRYLALSLLVSIGCATYHDELGRAQTAYDGSKHELALAILRDLEKDQPHFDATERARYAYLRGMTDQRIGYRADARHWLAIAKEIDEHGGGSLPPDWRVRLDVTLKELNEIVYQGGVAALEKPAADKKDEKSSSSTEKSREKPKPSDKGDE